MRGGLGGGGGAGGLTEWGWGVSGNGGGVLGFGEIAPSS